MELRRVHSGASKGILRTAKATPRRRVRARRLKVSNAGGGARARALPPMEDFQPGQEVKGWGRGRGSEGREGTGSGQGSEGRGKGEDRDGEQLYHGPKYDFLACRLWASGSYCLVLFFGCDRSNSIM